MQPIRNYISTLDKRYKTGISREHTYRGDLQNLLEAIAPKVMVTNEPARIACGAPDYILTQKNIPVGYIEAKDIGKALDSKDYKEQFDRYRKSLNNLIITDYLDFWFYRDGVFTTSIKIAHIDNGKIKPLPANYEQFLNLIKEFVSFQGQTIKSSLKLAQMMAGKARLLSQVLYNAVSSDEELQEDSSLKAQFKAFQDVLIHDINHKDFADIYAQTIAYGMFAARLHDPTLDDFSRQEAAELIPKSNPFLRKLFQYIAGYDLDDRIKWIVDALADIFRATDINALLKNFGKITQMNDPIIHFYETFLAEFDPKLRKSRGVYYTPEPVVNFIVRAIDHILKTDFDLPQGLADTSKTTIEVDTTVPDKRSKTGFKREKKTVHKVQFLDPATGTATFLAELIKQIYQKFEGQQGIWSKYAEDHLIPRMHGFEILMASYAMAHLKLEMLLRETGYNPQKEQRFKIYLTNALEEHHPDTGTLFANWLSTEASEANHVKRDTPVMVVLGNPPYSVTSINRGIWIQELISDYKIDLNEKKLNLDDDYIKFIRYGEFLIEKNGEGILAYISNNSFIDGVTHRQMRKHLLSVFDKIYIYDLHGNSKKQETTPDGTIDQNVFDIMQGVSINIFVKNREQTKGKLAKIYHSDLFGKREDKYNAIFQNCLDTIEWKQISTGFPYYFFIPKNYKIEEKYNLGFKLNELFLVSGSGIKTERDRITLHYSKAEIEQVVSDFANLNIEELVKKYNLPKDSRDWKVASAKNDILKCKGNKQLFINVTYRPFDSRHTYYTGTTRGFIGTPGSKIMNHLRSGENYAILSGRQNKSNTIDSFFITKNIAEVKCAERTVQSYMFPLFISTQENKQQSLDIGSRIPNFENSMISNIEQLINQKLSTNNTDPLKTFRPLDLLDYIYSVLHSERYREAYKEFLKIDFPRIPYPKDQKTFWQLVKHGGELRSIHLLESPVVEQFITSYPNDGDNTIPRRIGKKDFEITDSQNRIGRIWINEQQYFDNIPVVAWEFYIGGYQPAQKWLKDRKGRELSFEDIRHYQKIIVALVETDRIMSEIDKVEFM
jgi:predicted helicase